MRLVQFSSVTLIRLCCKLRILELMPSFIQFYCCCGLCRIFKLSSDFFAVIGLKTNILKMLEKTTPRQVQFLVVPYVYYIKISSAKNNCSSINMSKIVMKTVCYGGVQVRQNNNLCTSIFIRAKKNYSYLCKNILLVHKKEMTLWVSDIVSLIGNLKYVYREPSKLLIDKISPYRLLRRIFPDPAWVKKTWRGNHV